MIELLLLFRDGNRVSESLHDAYNYNSYYSSSYTDEVGGRTMVNIQPYSNIKQKTFIILFSFAVVVFEQRQHLGTAP